MSNLEKLLLIATVSIYTIISVFSYAYVDLNLTLSTNSLSLAFIGSMQKLGYYQRPLASAVYIFLISLAFGLYCINLYLAKKNKISKNYVVKAIIISSLILIFAYPFLSSDIFNYVFDAKIITHYHLNPYTHKALDFPNDDWTRFMRWTHRYSPYGPIWLLISVIPSTLGLGKFVLNLFLFKLMMAAFNLLNVYLIYNIAQKVKNLNSLVPIVFYALSPLVLIEGIANGHNDVLVATSILLSIYLLQNKSNAKSIITILIGTLIKYVPILMAPSFIFRKIEKKENFDRFIFTNFIIISLFTFVISTLQLNLPFFSSSTQTQFQPWYLFWIIPLIALLPKPYLIIPAIVISFGALLRYLPYLLYGDWSHEGTIFFMQSAISLPILVMAFFFLVIKLSKTFKNEKNG